MARYSKIPESNTLNSDLRSKGIRFYKTTTYPLVPNNPNDIFIITEFGDRLDSLAFKFYRNSSLYWIIYSANPDVLRADQLYLPAGIQIRIPVDTQSILGSFDLLNEAEER